MEGEDEIEVGQVDCGVSKPVCSKVDIHSYPTFKVFYEGEEVAKYKGIVSPVHHTFGQKLQLKAMFEFWPTPLMSIYGLYSEWEWNLCKIFVIKFEFEFCILNNLCT